MVDGRDFKLQIREGNATVTKSLHFLTDQVFGNFSDVPSMTLSGFEFNPQLWSEEAYKVGIEIYKVAASIEHEP